MFCASLLTDPAVNTDHLGRASSASCRTSGGSSIGCPQPVALSGPTTPQRLLEMTSLVADAGFQVVSLRLMMSVILGGVQRQSGAAKTRASGVGHPHRTSAPDIRTAPDATTWSDPPVDAAKVVGEARRGRSGWNLPCRAAKLPSVFLPDARGQPVLTGQSRTTTKGLQPANAQARGPFRCVAGAGFEPAWAYADGFTERRCPRVDLRLCRSPAKLPHEFPALQVAAVCGPGVRTR